jgi:excisionase family DNA binding protein
MEVMISDAAKMMGVSYQRVNAMARAGQIAAQKVGRHWLVDSAKLPKPSLGRPMSHKNIWALLLDDYSKLNPNEKSRLRKKISKLEDSESSEDLLRTWSKSRAITKYYKTTDLESILNNDKLIKSGVSSSYSDFFSNNKVEGYISEELLDDFVFDNLLVESERDYNLVLHICSSGIYDQLKQLDDLRFVVAADLSERNSPRELRAARQLIKEALDERN